MSARGTGRPEDAEGGRRGEVTRQRILDAALETLRQEGIAGTSARTIARAGGFAPGVLFYHYGSVEEVLVAAVRRVSRARIERFRPTLEQAGDLRELVRVARAIHQADMDDGQVAVFAQMLAATAGNPDLGRALHEVFDPWVELVRTTIERVLSGTPVAGMAAPEDLAYAVTAMFIGLELLEHLGGDDDRTEKLFDSFTEAADLATSLLALFRPGPSL